MNLVIDEGNTSVKIAIFNERKLQWVQNKPFNEVSECVKQLVHSFPLNRAIASSVVDIAQERFSFIKKIIPQTYYLSSSTPLPFVNAYATPLSLGADRIALVAAAAVQYPNKNVLVIDAGTCITFDFIDESKTFRGGAIAPGVQMRLRAMHEFTAKLPLIAEQDFDINNYIGNTTEKAMLSGVYNNIVCEIEGVITKYEKQYKNLTIVLTGGSHLYLVKNIKKRIFANPFFLIEGLDAILTFQKRSER